MKKTVLCILDGVGINEKTEGNAIKLVDTPNIDYIHNNYPTTTIQAAGKYVGILEGQMGNSEVGHINIGAGRIIYQETMKITNSINDGSFFKNKELNEAIKNVKKYNSKLHVMGLCSDKGVHSMLTHLYAILKKCKQDNLEQVYIHFFSDGRDSAATSGINYIKEIISECNKIGIGTIASIIGRYYAMDRDTKWEKTKKAYDLLINGIGQHQSNPIKAIENSYNNNITDEFIEPIIIVDINDKPIATIEENDSVIFFNYRHDRARQITRSIVDKDFDKFETKKFNNLFYVCMTEYDSSMPNVHTIIKSEDIKNTLGEFISNKGFKQLRISETEKFAHVTFFFNGGTKEIQFDGEDRIVIPSPKVPTFDLKPEMSINEVIPKLIGAINSKKYDLIVLNIPNPDMIGHTGNLEAAKKAIKYVDEAVGKITDATQKNDYALILTADHGNIEQMINYETKEPHTAHTSNPVHLSIVGCENIKLKKEGTLSNISPTILDIMGLEKPKEMTAESLIER